MQDSCQYLEIIIPSLNTQVSPYRDLFKGCNKAPIPLAKGFSSHSTPGFNNAEVQIALREIKLLSWRADRASQLSLHWENTCPQLLCKWLSLCLKRLWHFLPTNWWAFISLRRETIYYSHCLYYKDWKYNIQIIYLYLNVSAVMLCKQKNTQIK